MAAVLAARVEALLQQEEVAAAARSEVGRTGRWAGLQQEGTAAVAASIDRAAIKRR